MARLPRLTVAGYPHHVIHRGNNRQPIFQDDDDRMRLHALLVEHTARAKVAVHAYVMMDNHFHLLATPSSDAGLPQMMQAVGRRYVQYYNKRHSRTGTLWDGRYRATLVQTERYLLTCMVYIDLNPVRAGIVPRAGDFAWSSHRHYTGQRPDKLVTPHALCWALGNTPFAREAAYLDLVQQGVSEELQAVLTDSTLRGWALGDAGFVERLQNQTSRRMTSRRPGRPPARPPE